MSKGWEQKALSKHIGNQEYLETMDNEYWIIPKKLSVEAMQKISDHQRILTKNQDGICNLSDDSLAILKIAFLNGIYDHNFDDEVGRKIKWDINLFNSLLKYSDTLYEIFQKAVGYTRPLLSEKQEKSEMPQNGFLEEQNFQEKSNTQMVVTPLK